jgi:hypothetical protein
MGETRGFFGNVGVWGKRERGWKVGREGSEGRGYIVVEQQGLIIIFAECLLGKEGSIYKVVIYPRYHH